VDVVSRGGYDFGGNDYRILLRSNGHKQNDLPCKFSTAVDTKCPRVLELCRSNQAGLGHQLTELVFAAHLSEKYDAALHTEDFDDVLSNHNVTYAFITELLGLKALLPPTFPSWKLTKRSLKNSTSLNCGVFFQDRYQNCPPGNCFSSRDMAGAFARHSTCFQNIARTYGSWSDFSPYQASVIGIKVVWHLRLGDISPHSAESVFYRNIFNSLDLGLRAANLQASHFVLGNWAASSSEDVKGYKLMFTDMLGQPEFLSLDMKGTVLHMMHADVLVGGGSSLPRLCAFFAGNVHVNAIPFHKDTFLAEYLPGNIDVDIHGNVLTPIAFIKSILSQRARRAG
jgi:hypothetical protein